MLLLMSDVSSAVLHGLMTASLSSVWPGNVAPHIASFHPDQYMYIVTGKPLGDSYKMLGIMMR